MTDYKIVTLDKPDAKEYIRKCLKEGHLLSKYVLSTLDLENGIVTTALPENGNPENLYSFEDGGIIPETPKSEWKTVIGKNGNKSTWIPVHSITSYIVDVIHSYIQNEIRHICVIEDAILKPSDPDLESLKSLKLISDDVIYHLITSLNNKLEEIKNTIYSAGSIWPPSIAFLTSLSENKVFKNNQKIKSDIINVMAKNINKIIVGAYDMEGYLIWHKK